MRADGDEQRAAVGWQSAGRVAFVLETDDFARDHAAFTAGGVCFMEAPRQEDYGTVAVFEDLYGNRRYLIESISSLADSTATGDERRPTERR